MAETPNLGLDLPDSTEKVRQSRDNYNSNFTKIDTAVAGKYDTHPSGIPESDLETDVQSALGLARTAFQGTPTGGGGAVPDASTTTKGIAKIDLNGGTTAAVGGPALNAKISTTAAQTMVNSAVTDHAALKTGVHGIYTGPDVPPTFSLGDFVPAVNVLVAADGTKWVKTSGIADVPQNPGPVQSPLGQNLNTAALHYVTANLDSNGVPVSGGTTGSKAVARALLLLVLDRDRANFDKVLAWALTNLRRGKSGSGVSTFLEGWASASAANGTVSNYSIDTSAEAEALQALICAWNLWGGANYRDTGSYKAALLKAMTTTDENRGYLWADEASTHTFSAQTWVKCRVDSATNFVAFRMAKTFTGDVIFDQLVDGGYDLLSKTTATGGSLGSTPGLPPAFVAYNTSSHGVSAITNGVNGFTETLTTNFDITADDAVAHLVQDYKVFSIPAALSLLGPIKTFFVSKYGAGSIVTEYTHSGTAVGSAETSARYLRAVLTLVQNDSANSTAANIRANKIPTSLATDSNGSYYPNQIQGVTASASRDAEAALWILNALDSGTFNDIAKFGNNPNAGTTSPISGSPGPITIPPGGITAPVGDYPIYTDPNTLFSAWAAGLPSGTTQQQTWKSRAVNMAAVASAYWWGEWDFSATGLESRINAAAAQNKVLDWLMYYMTDRDLGGYSSGGATNEAAYKAAFELVLTKVGTKQSRCIFEPDSLTHAPSMSTEKKLARFALMTWAIQRMREVATGTWVYVDIGHPDWLDVNTAADLLTQVHIENAHGFSINVSNFVDFNRCVTYGQQICAKLNIPNIGFVIDTGRNGNPIPFTIGSQPWANPPRRRFGRYPQIGNTGIDRCHGWGWFKKPGESDGASGDGAPGAGTFWGTYMLNTAVGDNVDTDLVSTSSGLLQRPPSPGVAAAPPA